MNLSNRSKWLPAAVLGACLGLMLLVAATSFQSEKGLHWRAPQTLSGDEPHYLVVVNSLVLDHDLELQNNYHSVTGGGSEARLPLRNTDLDHHTWILDPATGRRALWGDVFDWRHPIDTHETGTPGFQRKTDDFPDMNRVVERSSHPVFFPMIVALPLALARTTADDVESRFGWIVVFIAWAGCVATFFLARCMGLSQFESLGASLILVLASPWLAYSRSYFAEPLSGLCMVLGLWAIWGKRPMIVGIVAVLAMAVKPAFLLIGAGWILERWIAGERRQALTIALTMGAGGLALAAFNYSQVGEFLVVGPDRFGMVQNPARLADTFLDINRGLFCFAPWASLAFIAMGLSLRKSADQDSRLLRSISIPCLLMTGLLMSFVSTGGACYGPRYWVPFLPWFAILAIRGMRGGLKRHWLAWSMITVSVAIAISGALCYEAVWYRGPLAGLKLLFS